MLIALATFVPAAAHAQDATWNLNAATSNFNAAGNWTPATVPTGTAIFDTSTTTNLTFSTNTSISGFTFNPGASAYSFSGGNTNFTGAGIVINGGSATIANIFHLQFLNASTAGNATIDNAFFLYFYHTSTAGHSAITNNLDLNFFNASTAGDASITNNSGLVFFHTSTAGNAAIANNANGGVVDFSGSTGPSSDHKLSAGSIAGGGHFYLGSAQLTVGGNNLSTKVSGVISDCAPNGIGCAASALGLGTTGGSLTKAGTGTLTLSGINIYTGATTVDAGALIVNGSIATSSQTSVNAGAFLAGGGTVGNTSIAGGTLSPGSAESSVFGPLTVQGNLSFTAASTYLIQVSPTNAGRTNVTGTATLGGATVNAFFQPGSYVRKQYTIVNATGGISGTFNPTVTGNLANFQTDLSYDANNAFLNLQFNLAPPNTPLNFNQQNVANALSNYFNGHGGIPGVFGTLTPAGLSQLAGETATGSQQTTFDAMNQFMSLLTDPFISGRSNGSLPASGATPYADEDARAYATKEKRRVPSEREAYGLMTKAPLRDVYDPRWSVWTAGFGGSQTTDGNTALGSNNTTSRVFGVAAGADYFFSPRTIAGFALAGGGTNFSVASNGSGRSDLFQAGAFIRHNVGPAYVTGAMAYGWQDITTDRTVTVAGIDRLRAQFNASAYSGRVEGGYRFVSPWIGGVGLTPYAAGQFTTFELPAYAEQVLVGANTFALAYGAKTVTASRSELGLRSDKSFAMPNGIFTLRGRAAWAHDYNTDRNAGATFQTLPGAPFVVNGAVHASDTALTTASAEMKWLNGFSLGATIEGEFSNVTSSYAGKGVARYSW